MGMRVLRGKKVPIRSAHNPMNSQRNRVSRASFEVLEVFRDGRRWTVPELAVLFGEQRARNALRILIAGGYVAHVDRIRVSKFGWTKVWQRTDAPFPEHPMPPDDRGWGSIELARYWGWMPKFSMMTGA
jgi:hypothetical protein